MCAFLSEMFYMLTIASTADHISPGGRGGVLGEEISSPAHRL
jgi:hypothetical protein